MIGALDLPTMLALFATALFVLAIFAPKPPRAAASLSFAPASAARAVIPVERWTPPPADDDAFAVAMPEPVARVPLPEQATWPALIDARATACDAHARLRLVDALGALRAAWADAVLERALADDPDETVRDAAGRALMRV